MVTIFRDFLLIIKNIKHSNTVMFLTNGDNSHINKSISKLKLANKDPYALKKSSVDF